MRVQELEWGGNCEIYVYLTASLCDCMAEYPCCEGGCSVPLAFCLLYVYSCFSFWFESAVCGVCLFMMHSICFRYLPGL